MKNFIPCLKCQDGYIYSKEGNEVVAHRCSCLTSFLKLKVLELKLREARIPLKLKNYFDGDIINLLDYSLDNYVGKDINNNLEKVNKYIENFKRYHKNTFLYFFGDNVTQKSTIGFYIARELIKRDVTVKYVLMNTLITNFVNFSFSKDREDLLEEIESYNNADLLIIDEAFKDAEITIYERSKFQIPLLIDFLRTRIEGVNKKSIIFISNISLENINYKTYTNSLKAMLERNLNGRVLEFLDKVWIEKSFDEKEIVW